MKSHENEIIYSEPVKEIMGRPPRKIVRWGTSVMFMVFVLFLIFAWLIRYPDTIPAPIEITTENPPVTLDSKISGRIRYLYVIEKEVVKAGQLLAVMETTANIKEIDMLEKSLDSIINPDLTIPLNFVFLSELGEIQQTYATFLKSLNDLNSYNDNDFYGNKIISLTDEIDGITEYIRHLKEKERLYSESQILEQNKFTRDSSLYIQKVIPKSEYDVSYQSLIRLGIDLQQVKLEQSAKKIEMAEKLQLLQDYRIKRVEEREKLETLWKESFMNLKANLNIWKNNYLLISPIDGTVTFTKYWSANQTVAKDEEVINIVPVEMGSILGRINLNMQRSGKVKAGQLVNIKLSGFPYLEYGMVRGVIKSKSLVPTGDAYILEIELPKGLTTLYGRELYFTQNMQGTAEVITDDVRLLQKIVNPLRYLLSKNKR